MQFFPGKRSQNSGGKANPSAGKENGLSLAAAQTGALSILFQMSACTQDSILKGPLNGLLPLLRAPIPVALSLC